MVADSRVAVVDSRSAVVDSRDSSSCLVVGSSYSVDISDL